LLGLTTFVARQASQCDLVFARARHFAVAAEHRAVERPRVLGIACVEHAEAPRPGLID
jgi:hypothetical protein